MKASFLTAGCLMAAVVVSNVAAGELEGVRAADTATVGGKTLALNGLGLRTRFGVAKVYVLALYLANKTNEGANALSQSGPKRLEFHLKRKVEAETFAKALNGGVNERASPEQAAALKDRIETLDGYILGIKEVKEGDVVDLDFDPSSGTQMLLNGKPVGGAIEGEEFYRAILDIFIGAKPVQESLKNGMLGAKG